ncbi:MAG: sigma-54 dependent transcriptional regulator [Phycisphaerae bacterium]|jgi:two-component system response regulator PilR (NtrC family)|nr:sigma-54 dependent transcriptional regulator [Phycisphaerae bacterium]
MAGTVLIAEDEVVLRESLAELLTTEGYRVLEACNGKEAWELASSEPVDVVLSDVRMPEMDGMALLDALQEMAPELPVVMLTAYGTVGDAVSAMRAGASDYLLKPVQFEEVLMRIERAMEHKDMARTSRIMTEQLSADSVFHNLVGRAPRMLELFDMVRKLSNVKSNVLIWGESGTGKELFARAIHYNSDARDKPFVPVNCGAIPENLAESELFGHRKGAFTGAAVDRVGYFEAADGGTLFLDEISTLPLTVQSSLLRALDSNVIVPVGDTRPRAIDLRVIAASNQDLAHMVEAGDFREDLLYRLNVVRLDIPPLRDRKEDIPMLVQHFLAKHCRNMNKHVTGVSDGAMAAILNCDWQGNVRELENVIERAVIFADGEELCLTHLPFATGEMVDDVGGDMKSALRQFERQHIMYSLRKCGYDKVETARHLGIGVSSLYRKLEEMGIPKSDREVDGEAGSDA